jgi:2-methylisocitrate lyase-like PEP mutase family enzyme
LGVRRISTGSALARVVFTALQHAAADMLNKGSFAYAGEVLSGEVLDGVMEA